MSEAREKAVERLARAFCDIARRRAVPHPGLAWTHDEDEWCAESDICLGYAREMADTLLDRFGLVAVDPALVEQAHRRKGWSEEFAAIEQDGETVAKVALADAVLAQVKR